MFDFLVDHARKNAWCTPRQDLQAIFRPARITSPNGVRATASHLWGNVPLPTSNDRYHVYQIGQINPRLLGLFPQARVWHTLSWVMEQENLIADVYTNSGLHFNRSEVWTLVTQEQNLLIAIREQPRIADLKTEPVYVRLYSNSYFGSDRADPTVERIVCRGKRAVNSADTLQFQHLYHQHRALTGYTWFFHNGVYVHDIIPQQVQPGDSLEFVYDSTVKRVLDFPVSSLQTFASILDQKQKYLIHYNGNQVPASAMIDYRDDIDFYLVKKTGSGSNLKWDGLYYHKNQDDAVRMVTHRDYALCVPYVDAYVDSYGPWTNVMQLSVRMVIRDSGYQRPLIDEHHRIKELYKLGDPDRLQAMLGVDASIDMWDAAVLENSMYPKIMSAGWNDITPEMVQEAYGYNAISKLVADSPLPVTTVNGRRQVTLPWSLRRDSTIYEYDSNGHLLGFFYHTLGEEYVPRNTSAELIEGIMGRGSYSLDTVFAENNVAIDQDNYNYRFYIADIQQGNVKHDTWRDVTDDGTKYQIVNGAVQWLTDPLVTATAIKSDKTFLAYEMSLAPINGLLKFSIDSTAVYPNGSAQGVMFIPPGKIDIWMNGKALIENLDFHVRWPQIVIVNKEHLNTGLAQNITVRCTGFCKSDMSREAPAEFGFIKYGLLSRNEIFNIRDDKVIRIVARGRTFHRSAMKYAENDTGLTITAVTNGSPYVLEDVIVPLRGLIGTDPYSFREVSKAIDKKVSDYLTLKKPEPIKTTPDMIPDKYPIYSPFASTIMYDLMNGILSMDSFKGQYSDQDVRDFLTQYEYLLDYDPCLMNHLDLDYVAIHPHNRNVEMELNIYQYNFLARAIKTYLDDKVDITRFIRIKESWI